MTDAKKTDSGDSLEGLANPCVRDLAWVMRSPSLMAQTGQQSSVQFVSDEYCQTIYRQSWQWLQQQDRNSQSLAARLKQRKSRKLGYYFEDLVAYWLENRIADVGVESHVKVIDRNRDIGEFDFLFSSGGRVWHWETAVKYYLYVPGGAEDKNWYGPNARDTLFKKLTRLSQHQIRLSEFPEPRKLLNEKGIQQLQPQIFMKGYLFYPPGIDVSQVNNQVAGLTISPKHLRGWWLPMSSLDSDFLQSTFNRDLKWRVIPRLEWLAERIYQKSQTQGFSIYPDSPLLSAREIVGHLREEFGQTDESRLLAGYFLNGAGQWQEACRGFVVGRHWPEVVEGR